MKLTERNAGDTGEIARATINKKTQPFSATQIISNDLIPGEQKARFFLKEEFKWIH